MDLDSLDRLTRILQLSIGPVALISGVGLLLLSMVNRLGRVFDRARHLGNEIASAPKTERSRDASLELHVLFRRARLLQLAIALIIASAFVVLLIVGSLFATYLFALPMGAVILLLFALCLVLLVASLSCFLGDIFLSIRSLRVSLGRYLNDAS